MDDFLGLNFIFLFFFGCELRLDVKMQGFLFVDLLFELKKSWY